MVSSAPPKLVSFNSRVVAGQTEIHSRRHEEIYRLDGMDGWILNYTEFGAGTINRRTQPFDAGVGTLLLFPPSICHDYGAARPSNEWTHDWVYFFPRAGWLELMLFPESHAGVRSLNIEDAAVQKRIVVSFNELIRVTRSSLRQKDAITMNLLESILLWADSVNPVWTQQRVDSRVQETMRYIAHEYQRPLTLQDLARHTALSISRLAHLFREQLGMTPMEYVEEQRIGQARELLLMNDQPIAWVATEVGFEDPLYFSRVFRRRTGRSPREWRSTARHEIGGLGKAPKRSGVASKIVHTKS